MKDYLKRIFDNLETLSEKDKIKKNIERYHKNIKNREKFSKILFEKC